MAEMAAIDLRLPRETSNRNRLPVYDVIKWEASILVKGKIRGRDR